MSDTYYYLQPALKNTKAYLEELPKDRGPWILATANVSSLYTIIFHHQACKATKSGLRKYPELPCPQRKYLVKCLDFCLKNSYFWYDRNYYYYYYHQKTGVAMGAKFAPSVASLWMAKWEDEMVFTDAPTELVIFKWFIDDIFILWKGEETRLVQFLENLNMNYRNITLTWEISKHNMTFMDLEIMQEDQVISTKTHFKNVDKNSYLPMESCHHQNWLCNIPKEQLMRLRRNCMKNEDFLIQAEKIGHRFIDKGYNHD